MHSHPCSSVHVPIGVHSYPYSSVHVPIGVYTSMVSIAKQPHSYSVYSHASRPARVCMRRAHASLWNAALAHPQPHVVECSIAHPHRVVECSTAHPRSVVECSTAHLHRVVERIMLKVYYLFIFTLSHCNRISGKFYCEVKKNVIKCFHVSSYSMRT